MSDSLEHGAPLELVEGLGMARCSLCKAQLLITIVGMARCSLCKAQLLITIGMMEELRIETSAELVQFAIKHGIISI